MRSPAKPLLRRKRKLRQGSIPAIWRPRHRPAATKRQKRKILPRRHRRKKPVLHRPPPRRRSGVRAHAGRNLLCRHRPQNLPRLLCLLFGTKPHRSRHRTKNHLSPLFLRRKRVLPAARKPPVCRRAIGKAAPAGRRRLQQITAALSKRKIKRGIIFHRRRLRSPNRAIRRKVRCHGHRRWEAMTTGRLTISMPRRRHRHR